MTATPSGLTSSHEASASTVLAHASCSAERNVTRQRTSEHEPGCPAPPPPPARGDGGSCCCAAARTACRAETLIRRGCVGAAAPATRNDAPRPPCA